VARPGRDHSRNRRTDPRLLALVTALRTFAGPVSGEVTPLAFRQVIGASNALRTGTYAKTLTFALSTTAP
jgi:hypothetical protein